MQLIPRNLIEEHRENWNNTFVSTLINWLNEGISIEETMSTFDQPLAIAIFPASDWNHAFLGGGETTQTLIQNNFMVIY